MKVYIGPPKYWIGSFQITDVLLFFVDQDRRYDITDKLVNRFPVIQRICEYFDSKRKRTVCVKLHDYDHWNADSTIAYIILPLLKKVQENKQGAPFIDDGDVPDELKSTSAPPKKDIYDVDDNHFKRFDWVLDEMIWAFEQINSQWEDQYHISPGRYHFEKSDTSDFSIMVYDEEPVIDLEGLKNHQDRITRGLMLFGKYYQSLWT